MIRIGGLIIENRFLSLKKIRTLENLFDLVIVGGGLAGLTAANHLASHNIRICLIEKKPYPSHKVCGEYVSNEVLPYLNFLGIDPFSIGAKKISQFEISDSGGNPINVTLPLGGFGISRFSFDHLLYEKIKNSITILIDTVTDIQKNEELFTVTTQGKNIFQTPIVLGAFGKRSNMDTFMKRNFIQKKSPWLAVKCHYKYDFPDNRVVLHNFKGGYCGLSKTEDNVVNACYLATFNSFKKVKNVEDFQCEIMSQNPHLKHFFKEAVPVFEKPITISQISFDKKKPVENQIFMVGDSAGLIHPLCGNGMAMAILGAKLFSEVYLDYYSKKINRKMFETQYEKMWNKEFSNRLKTGYYLQKVLMNPTASKYVFKIGRTFPSLVSKLIKQTHGTIEQTEF